jgi:hypothetical protein
MLVVALLQIQIESQKVVTASEDVKLVIEFERGLNEPTNFLDEEAFTSNANLNH